MAVVAMMALKTANRLADREITTKQADHTFHLLEYNMNSTILLIEIIPHVVA